MRKSVKAAIGILLICAFAFSAATRTIPLAKADYDQNYLPSAAFYTTNWVQSYTGGGSETEGQVCSDTFNYLDNLFSQQQVTVYSYPSGQELYQGPTYGKVYNWGDSTCTGLIQNNIAEDTNEYYNQQYLVNTFPISTTLYVGHGGDGAFLGYDSNPNTVDNPSDTTGCAVVSSTDISNANPQDEKFVFLWVCMNGYDSSTYNNIPLMATAWSNGQIQQCDIGGNNGWNPDSSGYAYIAFYLSSPWLIDRDLAGQTTQSWLENFYYIALWPGDTINEAMDMASYEFNGNTGNSTLLPFGTR